MGVDFNEFVDRAYRRTCLGAFGWAPRRLWRMGPTFDLCFVYTVIWFFWWAGYEPAFGL